MNKRDERVMRAIMEGMTEDLDMMGKMKTWQRMLAAANGKRYEKEAVFLKIEDQWDAFTAPLQEIEIDRDAYHKAVVDACREAIAVGPSLDYPEATRDRAGVEKREVESYLSTEELMLIGQSEMIKKLKQIEKSEALREKLARRVMLKLI